MDKLIERRLLNTQGWVIDDSAIPKWMTYYKPNGEAVKLPSDSYSLKHYLARGFTLEPPKEVKPMKSAIGVADIDEKPKVAKPVKKRSVRAKHKRKTKET